MPLSRLTSKYCLLVALAGSQIKASPKQYDQKRRKSKVDEARDIMAYVLWCHVAAPKYNFQQKLA